MNNSHHSASSGVAAYENAPADADFIAVAEALLINDERVVLASADAQLRTANRTRRNGPFHLRRKKSVARDFLLPWVTYGKTESGQLLVEASFGRNLNPALGEDAILEIAQVVEGWDPGDLGIHFTVKGGDDQISLLRGAAQLMGAQAAAVKRFAKNAGWEPSDDPRTIPKVRILPDCSRLAAANDNMVIQREVA